jgi:sugar lactone lactonase YvrE
MPHRPYTVEWQGRIYIPEDGAYAFGTEQSFSSVLYIDGKEVINNPTVNSYVEVEERLSKGWHDLRLLYVDETDASHMYLYWRPPGRARSIIPSAFLQPKMGDNPVEVANEDLPTLDDSDGSKLQAERVAYISQTRSDVPVEGSNLPPKQAVPQPPAQSQPPAQPAANEPNNPSGQFTGETLNTVFVVGEEGNKLNKPRAAAADAEGNIYIFTEGDSKVHKLDPTGKELKAWDVKNKEGQPLTEGSALVVLGDQVLVLDAATSSAIKFTLDGEPQGEMALCVCFFPRDMAASRDGNLWLANTGSAQVLKISPQGTTLRTIGDRGAEPGKFLEPAGVWEAKDGTLFVADIGNKRVQSLTADGLPLKAWPIGDSVARDGNRLVGNEEGNVLVTQFESRAVVKYDREGKELGRWIYRAGGDVLIPSGIAAVGDGKFVVLFTEAGRAAVFTTEE